MKQIWMPEYLYTLGMPFEWFEERIDKNNVFKPSNGMIKFIKNRIKVGVKGK